MRLSAACRLRVTRTVTALLHQDLPPLPTQPWLSRGLLLLSHCSVTPGTSSTPPTLRCGQAAQAGPWCRPAAPPQGTLSCMHGAARTLPASHVCASGEATFGLARHIPSSTDACPPLPGWGHVCGAAGLPNHFPALAGRQQTALGSPQPPASFPRGLGHHSGGSSPGRGCISLPDTSLPHGLYLKGGKSQLGARHSREWGVRGREALSAMAVGHVGWGVHRTWQHGEEDAYHARKAQPLCCTSSPGQALAWHSPRWSMPCRWGYGTQEDWQPLPASPACATQCQPGVR